MKDSMWIEFPVNKTFDRWCCCCPPYLCCTRFFFYRFTFPRSPTVHATCCFGCILWRGFCLHVFGARHCPDSPFLVCEWSQSVREEKSRKKTMFFVGCFFGLVLLCRFFFCFALFCLFARSFFFSPYKENASLLLSLLLSLPLSLVLVCFRFGKRAPAPRIIAWATAVKPAAVSTPPKLRACVRT